MRIDVVTIFPEAFESPLRASLLGKALQKGLVEVVVHDLRRWSEPPHNKVDDQPYGGGAGMVMMPGPVVDAVESVIQPEGLPILLSASGRPFDHASAKRLAAMTQLVIVCGRYEGLDHRIGQVLGAEELSIGQFVLSGGEFAALVVIDAVARLLPGVMGNQESLNEESFGSGLLEYPQYTRPQEFRGLKVPEVLLSGNHAEIIRWQRTQSLRQTFKNRPEMLSEAELSSEESVQIERWRTER